MITSPMPSVPGTDIALTVEDLHVSFSTPDGVVNAVRGVSFEVRPGEVLGIVGESGSGKSVTSLAIMGLLPAGSEVTGSAHVGRHQLIGLPDSDLSKVRGASIAMIFQDPLASLTPVYTVGAQLAEAVTAHHDVSKAAARERAIELLNTVGIPHPSQRADAYPHELSGGMRQRVVIAMAMANDPSVIIADEPTTALDVTIQAQVLEALETARSLTHAAMVLITHDLGVIAGHADRVGVMYAGRLVETGTVDDIFHAPRMPYTLGLLGSLPRLDAVSHERLTPIVGAPPSLLRLPPGCPFTPRCPLAASRCSYEEPALLSVAANDHTAACHYSDQLTNAAATDVFHPTSIDRKTPGEIEGDR